jgi:hypothetical protein
MENKDFSEREVEPKDFEPQVEDPDYKVLEYNSKAELAQRVVVYMKEGWKPQGGIHVRHIFEFKNMYSQAIVKW